MRATLPELPLANLRAAVNLCSYGATAENLVRLLGLTESQALRISEATRNDHGG